MESSIALNRTTTHNIGYEVLVIQPSSKLPFWQLLISAVRYA